MTPLNTIIIALLAISEVLALIPQVGSNSIFQLIVSILKQIGPSVRRALGLGKKDDSVKEDKSVEESK
jgi:hypothetical protein